MNKKPKKKHFIDVMKVWRERWLKELAKNIKVEDIKFVKKD